MLIAMFFISLPSSAIDVEEITLDWTYEFDHGYITTAPVISDDTIFVRSSGFWSDDARPKVVALNHDGEVKWEYTNNNSVQHDMSPLIDVQAGEGECGSWDSMLIVPWANGEITAHNTSNGDVLWTNQSYVQNWGVTGQAVIQNDLLVAPTRNGLSVLCLADGHTIEEFELGLGWRNGVAVDENGYWIGDENGTLWHVENGTIESFHVDEGLIRHAPILTSGGVLIHVQTDAKSNVFFFNTSSKSISLLNESGPSPGIPKLIGDFVVTTDSSYVRIFNCSGDCKQIDSMPSHSNGEIGVDRIGRIWLPQNVMEGGLLILTLNSSGHIEYSSPFNTTLDGYSTAAPVFGDSIHEILVMGNDFGILQFYSSEVFEAGEDSDYRYHDLLIGISFFAFIFLCGHFIVHGSEIWALRLFFTSILISILLLSPEIILLLEDSKPEAFQPTSNIEQWSSDWPSDWQDTQVVIIELPNGEIVDGGYTGYDNVYSLTRAMAEQNDIDIEIEEFHFGTFIVSFSGVEGNGWEFKINGTLGTISADQTTMPDSGILRWMLAS